MDQMEKNDMTEVKSTETSGDNKNKAPMYIIILIIILVAGGYWLFAKDRGSDENNFKTDDGYSTGVDADNSNTEASPENTNANLPPAGEVTNTPAPTDAGAVPPVEAVKTFTITASNFSFTPAEIKVKKGDQVKIILDNKEGFHDFVLDEFKVRTKQIKAGETDTVSFTADKAGTFEYYCSVGKHRQMGMKGNLIVE